MRRTIRGNFEQAQRPKQMWNASAWRSFTASPVKLLWCCSLVFWRDTILTLPKKFGQERNPVQRSSTVEQCQLGGGGRVVVKGMIAARMGGPNTVSVRLNMGGRSIAYKDPKTSITPWETPSRTTRAGVQSLPDLTGTVIGFPTLKRLAP